MSTTKRASRLSLVRAAFVIARRDFGAILFSRAFLFFLLGPLFPIIVGALAGGIGQRVAEGNGPPAIGIAMEADAADAVLRARDFLEPQVGGAIPDMFVIERLEPGQDVDPMEMLESGRGGSAAILSGSLEAPVLTATEERLDRWKGPVSLIAATALDKAPETYPEVALNAAATSAPNALRQRLVTAQGAQTLLFLLIMLLAGMVLSNLVEEKGNKIIEILAAAVPMDAVFLGKLFAMLAVSAVGLTVWGTIIGGLLLASASDPQIATRLAMLTTPGVGWPMFVALFAVYFAMGYLLLGSIFLAIGSLATTVREVQTLSMPVTMGQVLIFFLASYALADAGSTVEWVAILFPLSSPFAMLGRAALYPNMLQHVAAIGWQIMWVGIFIRLGAGMFRRRVMQSGPRVKNKKRGLFPRRRKAEFPVT